MSQINTTMGPVEWSLLIVLSLLWGGSFFFVGVAIKVLPPFTIVLLRVGLAALTLHLVLRFKQVRFPKERQILAAFLGMGLLNNVIPFTLIVWGQSHIASGLASILNATTPIFTLLVAHTFTQDEKLSPGRLLGISLGFFGVVVIIGMDSLGGLGTDTLAQLAVLGAALSYAFAGVFGRRFHKLGVPPMITATGQVTASTLVLLPVVLLVDQPWNLSLPGGEAWAAIVALAIFSTALAYILYFRILATAGATNLLLVTFLIPVTAILLGAVFLGEQLTPKDYCGMVLIGLGLIAIDGRVVKRLDFSFSKKTL